MKVLVSGSTGFLGSALVEFLKRQDHEVVRLVRQKAGTPEQEVVWQPNRGELDVTALQGLEAAIHLAGENLFSLRWTADKKQRIRDSRVNGTKLLSSALAELDPKPRVLISASAIGFYGDRGDEVLDEDSLPADSFLANVCRDWEAATGAAKDAGIRVVNLRLGVVLHTKGGALKTMLPAFRLGAGGVVGPGTQYFSWIEREDCFNAMQFCLLHEELAGPVNATAPNPVTNREFTQTLSEELKRPARIPVPAGGVKLLFGQMGEEMLLASARVVPKRLKEHGFEFRFGHVQPALHHLLQKPE